MIISPTCDLWANFISIVVNYLSFRAKDDGFIITVNYYIIMPLSSCVV